MGSTRRGGALELAIKRAGAGLYRPAGRACITQQFPDIANMGDGTVGYASGAPVDFLGALQGGRLIAIEAKSTKGQSLATERLRPDQQRLMGILASLGADVRLVIAFGADGTKTLGEVYSIGWPAVATFLAVGWRASFSRTWARVEGLHLPVEHPGNAATRRVLWLDGHEHPDRRAAVDQLEAEKARRAPTPSALDDNDMDSLTNGLDDACCGRLAPPPLTDGSSVASRPTGTGTRRSASDHLALDGDSNDIDDLLAGPPAEDLTQPIAPRRSVGEVLESVRRAAEEGVARQLACPRRAFRPQRSA